jgi:hypothetical protein
MHVKEKPRCTRRRVTGSLINYPLKKLLLILLIFLPNFLFAQLVNDLKVNLDTNISYPKYFQKLSSNNKGNTVVTWEESNLVNKINVYAQIFDTSFHRVGNNFIVNSILDTSQKPDVVVRKDGSFGILWYMMTNNLYGSKILLKIYNKYGIPISSEIQINDTIKEYGPQIRIGTDSLNRFIIAFSYPNPSRAMPDIFYQIVDSNGFKIGNNVKVNQNYSYGKPALVVKRDGGFIITWEGALGNYLQNIYCQLFSKNGTPIGNNQQVNDIETNIDTLNNQQLPDIAVDSSGNFVIGFKETPYSSGVERIKYQRFDKNGNKIGVNKIINDAFYESFLSSDEEGNLIFLLSASGYSGFLYNLKIDKNDNPIGTYFLASNQLPNSSKGGTDVVMVNKKFINLWKDNRLSNQPQVFLNVRSYVNPDSVVYVSNINMEIPSGYSLSQNYPNPFNPITKIKFSIVSSPHGLGGDLVQIKVFEVTGREVQTLVNESLKPGTYETTFDGSSLNSGVYFYKLTVGNGGSSTLGYTETKRMVLLK